MLCCAVSFNPQQHLGVYNQGEKSTPQQADQAPSKARFAGWSRPPDSCGVAISMLLLRLSASICDGPRFRRLTVAEIAGFQVGL